MGRPHKARWHQVTLLDDAPGQPHLPSEIRLDVMSALADLLLAHLRGDATPDRGEHDEFEDRS